MRNNSNSMQQYKQKGLMIFKTMRPFYFIYDTL